MINYSQMKRTALVSIFSALLSTMALGQSSMAVNVTPVLTDDFTLVGQSYFPGGSTDLLEIRYGSDYAASFLKFNVSGLSGQNIQSAQLDLQATLSPQGTANLYFFSDDNWVNETLPKMADLSVLRAANPMLIGSLALNNGLNSFVLNSTGIDLLKNQTDNHFSIMLAGDISSPVSLGSFYSKESSLNGPVLNVEVSPVPEPSSMVLGIMGLGSLLGFRRNNKKASIA